MPARVAGVRGMAELSPEQLQAAIAAALAQQANQTTKTTPAPMQKGKGSGAKSVAAGDILAAPKGSDYLDGFVDDNGKYDGEYEVTILSCEVKNAEKGQLFEITMQIDSSSNDRIKEGSKRQHAIFWWSPAGKGETRTLWEKFMEAKGCELTADNAEDIYGEAQCMASTRWSLSVSTRPQKRDRSKSFTHHRYSSLD
jgi:hypothetical protein